MDDDARAAARRDDAALVERARADDSEAFGQLYDRWFDRVHDLAFRITKDSSAASDVAQDAFLAAWNNLAKLQDPQAFGGWLLRIARNGAFDRARREQRSRPLDAEAMAAVESSGPSPVNAPAGFRIEDRARTFDDPARAAEDGELVALVWEAAAALGTRDAELLDLSLRHGLTPAELGEVVGMNRNAANQAVHRVRGRLKHAIEARVLWRSGEPVCAGLAAALDGAGVKEFGADAVRVASAHAETCAECQERRETRLEPSKLFGALPFLVVPMLLKMRVAHALSETGVPMEGSEAYHYEGRLNARTRRRVRHVIMAGGVVVIAFVGVGVNADELHEVLIAETEATTTTTLFVTTTTAPPAPTTSTTVTTETTAPDAPTGRKIFVPPPPPPAATASISISPSTEANGFTFGRVTVTWSTSGGATVRVTSSHSAEGLVSTASSGTESVCPGTLRGGPPGCYITGGFPQTFTYTVNVYDAAGAVVATRSATLTVTF